MRKFKINIFGVAAKYIENANEFLQKVRTFRDSETNALQKKAV